MGSGTYFKYHPSEQFPGKKVLNIGCGYTQFKTPNVVNLDAFAICKPDVVHNLEKMPLPFKDEEFDLIIANHILEHVRGWWGVVGECARILKPGGVLEIWVPGEGSSTQRGYRDHLVTINDCSFSGIDKAESRNTANAWAEVAKKKSPTNRLFLERIERHLFPLWYLRYAPECLRKFMITHLRNIVSENGYFLIKKQKGEE